MSGDSLQACLTRRVEATPEAPFVIQATSGVSRTYAEVYAQARRWAWFFRNKGLQARDRVAVILPNSPEFVDLYLGAALSGVTVCPYNPALSDGELSALIARYGARLAIAAPAKVAALETPAGPEVLSLSDALAALPDSGPALESLDPETPMVLIMTSGTTGGVKACVLTQANLAWTSAWTVEAFGIAPGSRYLTPLPLFHINAQVIGLWAAVQGGGAVAVGARLPAAKLWEAAARSGATGMSTVPAMIHDLLELPGEPPASLAYVVCSSAPLPVAVRERFEARFGIPLLFCYGLSEAGCFVSYSRPSPPSPAGSVGKPLGCEVRIVDGEVLVRGPGLFAGYAGDPEATALALEAGWLRTGDVGELDDEGFLYLRGRSKDLINRGGEKIAPDAIEAVLRDCPGLLEVAVFAVPDERLGEEVAAAIVLKVGHDLSDDDLWDFCGGRLAEFETPRYWKRLEAMPRGATGKVLRRVLKETFQR